MNEQLQKSMAEILALLTESAKTVGEAAQQEVPLLVQEYLQWGFWSAVVCAVSALVFLLIVWLLTARWLRADEARIGRGGYSDGDTEVAAWGVRVLAVVILGVITFSSAYSALQVTVAPRVYLLETVIEAIK